MANFEPCIEWVLRLEDRKLSGVVRDLGDGGGRTRFGITERDNPEISASFFTCDSAAALEEAKAIYRKKYWEPLCGESLPTDELAATLLSFAVNDGRHQAVRELQQVVRVPVDCVMGASTIAAINASGRPESVAQSLRARQEVHYRWAAEQNPDDRRFLDGWLKRARVVYPALPD